MFKLRLNVLDLISPSILRHNSQPLLMGISPEQELRKKETPTLNFFFLLEISETNGNLIVNDAISEFQI